MSDTTKTAPIPSGRYAAPEPAPNTPTECPRCGAPAISRKGVAAHELWHRQRDVLEKRLEKTLDRLEGFLDSIEDLADQDGKPQKFAAWKHEIDGVVEELPDTETLEALKRLSPEGAAVLLELAKTDPKESSPTVVAAPEPRIIDWPGSLTAEPDDDDLDEPVAIVGTGADGSPLVDAMLGEPDPDEDELAARPLDVADTDLDDDAENLGPWGIRR